MATAFASLPKVNQSHQRTRLRPRDLVGVAYLFTGSPKPYAGTVRANNAPVTTTGVSLVRLQEYLDIGLTKIAP
jgi:hypothetical protein